VPDRHPHGAFDQGLDGDADAGVIENNFPGHSQFCATTRDAEHRDRATMKTPVALVAVTLAVAILLAASLVIATGTRGESAPGPRTGHPAGRTVPTPPAAK
jgi:hypothetical protein